MNSSAMTNAGGGFVPRVNPEKTAARPQTGTQQVGDDHVTPTSLIMTIDRNDMVVDAAIHETSYGNSDKYIIREFDKVDWEGIPNHTVVEYRFPDQASVPSLDPGAKNGYYSRDFYYAVDGMDVPRQYIPLPVAYYLSSNNYHMFQSDETYRRIEQCSDYREFAYRNERDLDRHPERMSKADVEALAAIRASGGPVLSDLPLVGIWPGAAAEVKNPKEAIKKTWDTKDLKRKPYVPTRRIVINPPKRTKGRSL
jgi:hypothetical protein